MRFARFIAVAMIGAVSLEKPAGSPRLRNPLGRVGGVDRVRGDDVDRTGDRDRRGDVDAHDSTSAFSRCARSAARFSFVSRSLHMLSMNSHMPVNPSVSAR